MLVLHENSSPIQIDPVTLKTITKWDLLGDQSWKKMTAHPKICPLTKVLHTYSYDPLQKELVYYQLDQFGEMINSFDVQLPYIPLLIHDFAVTEDYVIFMFFPLVIEPSSSKNKLNNIVWRSHYQTQIIVYDKHKGTPVCSRYFDASYAYHFINAYQKENSIVLDLFLYEGEIQCEDFWKPLDKPSYPTRIEVSLFQNDLHIKRLLNLSGDFGSIDPRKQGREYDQFFMCASTHNKGKKYEFNSIVAFNLINFTYQNYEFGESACCSEPFFVNVFDQTEGRYRDYILTLVYDKSKDTSQFVIFLAHKIQEGPICRLPIASRVPFGFHGTWVPK